MTYLLVPSVHARKFTASLLLKLQLTFRRLVSCASIESVSISVFCTAYSKHVFIHFDSSGFGNVHKKQMDGKSLTVCSRI